LRNGSYWPLFAIHGIAALVCPIRQKYQIIVHAQAFGMGQEQATLKPMVEGIKKNLGNNIFNPSLVLTADTGFSSEATMQYLFDEKINAVVPDNQFRKRNPIFSDSEFYKKHKLIRKKTRKDQSGRDEVFHSSIFTVNLDNNSCICPAGKELLFLGDAFEGARGIYSRFRGKLKVCNANPVHEKAD
jgi:hypothetical protein